MANRTIGRKAPKGPDWIPHMLADLQRQINELRSARTLETASISKGGLQVKNGGSITVDDGGDITINDGGTFSIFDAAGNLAVLAGYAAISGHTGLATQRPDGTTSFQADDSAGGFTAFFDREEHIIVSDDATSGKGLAAPHIGLGVLVDTNVATWPATTSGSFVTIAQCFIERQNPRVAWTIAIAAYGAGVTGQFKLLLNGVQLGSTQSVTNTVAYWSDIDSWPSSIDVFGENLLELQARVSAGSGTAAGQQMRLRGMGS